MMEQGINWWSIKFQYSIIYSLFVIKCGRVWMRPPSYKIITLLASQRITLPFAQSEKRSLVVPCTGARQIQGKSPSWACPSTRNSAFLDQDTNRPSLLINVLFNLYYLIFTMIRYLLLLSLLVSIFTDCAFKVKDNLEPYKPEGDDVKPQPITKVMCTDDWGDGRLGCCNDNAFRQTENSFKKIDTVFGSGTSGGSGGCDLCAINLKRFWCQYACDPNQTNFVRIGNWVDVPSFDHPGEMVHVQEVFLTVESTTACRLFQSCQRTSYASQLSALQSPAGFLNFQGTNAIEDATQIIYVDFSDDKTKGLYIEELDNCSVKLPTPPDTHRGFQVQGNCTCNTCQSECSGGSYYEPTPIMQGFNTVLVAAVWGGVLALVVGITAVRFYLDRKKKLE